MTDDGPFDYDPPSVGWADAGPITGPPTTDGCLYRAVRVQHLGMKDRLDSVHATPEDAFQAIVEHVGHAPEDYTPEFPEGDWGERVWGWHERESGTYLIQQFRWSGADTREQAAFPTEYEIDDD